MASQALSRGDIFAGRYKVDRTIGAGGMGTVFEAEHLETERKVALKVLLPQSLVSEPARERFKQEARVAGRLRHPNVVDVLDAGVDDITGMPYLVMELLHGEDLGSRLDRLGPLPPEETVTLLHQIASALDCLHERSIVHRDLKPENLFLTWSEDGRPVLKLLDFGVAKVIAEGKTSAFTLDAQGTPAYMAPEQFAEQIRISPATDIYALGMLAFTLLTGSHYWGAEVSRGMNVFMLARIAEAGPKEPATVRAQRAGTSLPAAFDEWFSTITAIVPGERYPTATVAIELLADVFGVELAIEPAPRSHVTGRLSQEPRPSVLTPAGLTPRAPPRLRPSHEPRTPVSERESQIGSGSTPALLLARPRAFWRQPMLVALAFFVLAAAVTVALALGPTSPLHPPSRDGMTGAVMTLAWPVDVPEPRPVAPIAPEPSSTGSIAATAPLPSTPADPTTTAPLPSTSSSTRPVVRPPPRRPAAAPVGSKRPKYTRE